MNRDTTFCHKCKHVMPVGEYLVSERCPLCGASFTAAQYRVDAFLALAGSSIGWIIYWNSPGDDSLLLAIALTGGAIFFLIATYVIEKVLLRTTSLDFDKRHKHGMTIAIIIVVTLLYFIAKPG